jgi:hypothetical protein
MMETTSAYLRRQGRLLTALLDRADEAIQEGDWLAAVNALEIFERRLQRHFELLHGSIFPWIERRVGHFSAIDDLQQHEDELVEALASHRLGELRSLLDRYLSEEDQVVWPMVEFRA